MRTRRDELLLGEWCCLGLLAIEPAHGFALARRLAPGGDLGRIWSLSRPLTYRALARLVEEGLIEPVAQEPGVAGGDRTIYRPTPRGRSRLRRWLTVPVPHVRDVRSELLVKLELCRLLGRDRGPLVAAQRALIEERLDAAGPGGPTSSIDPVELWRDTAVRSVLAFLDRLDAVDGAGRRG